MSSFRFFRDASFLRRLAPFLGFFLLQNARSWGAYTPSLSARNTPLVSPLTTGVNLVYFPLALQRYAWTPGQPSQQNGHALTLEVEWLPFADLWGKPAIGTTFGYQWTKGLAVNGASRDLQIFPMGMFVVYRFDYMSHQWLVPFVKAGGSVCFIQRSSGGRVDNASNWDYGGGLTLSLGAIDSYSVRHLDSQIGINDVFLSLEYVKSEPMQSAPKFNLSHEEFRVGVRLEI